MLKLETPFLKKYPEGVAEFEVVFMIGERLLRILMPDNLRQFVNLIHNDLV